MAVKPHPKSSPSLYLVAIVLLLLLQVDLSVSSSPPASPSLGREIAPETRSAGKASATRIVHTATPVIRAASTKSSKTSKSKEKTYTWKAVSSRPNCPSYSPTESLATQTASSNGVQVTAFINPFGGKVPSQFAVKNETRIGDPMVIKQYNLTQIFIYQPNTSLVIIDNNGIVAYDPQCKNGARLSFPGFLNFTGERTSTRLRRLTRSSLDQDLAPGSTALAPRATNGTTFSVAWQFTDTCGRPKVENILSERLEFECSCTVGLLNPQGSYQSLGNGAWVGKIQSPSIDPNVCAKQIDDVIHDFTSGPFATVAEYWAGGSYPASRVAKTSAGAAVTALLEELGLAAGLASVSEILAAVGFASFVLSKSAPLLKKGLCNTNGYQYRLTASTEHYGLIPIDAQSAPFHNVNNKKVPLPTSDQDKCGCADYNTDSNNCGSCGNVCPSGQTCQKGKCAEPPIQCPNRPKINPCVGSCGSPVGGCPSFYGQDEHICSEPNPYGTCVCRTTMAGDPVCVYRNFDQICGTLPEMGGCTSDRDCDCGSRCVRSDNCCGAGICAYGGGCTNATQQTCFGHSRARL